MRRRGKPTRATPVLHSPSTSADVSQQDGSRTVRHSSRVAQQGGRPDYSALAKGKNSPARAQAASTSVATTPMASPTAQGAARPKTIKRSIGNGHIKVGRSVRT